MGNVILCYFFLVYTGGAAYWNAITGLPWWLVDSCSLNMHKLTLGNTHLHKHRDGKRKWNGNGLNIEIANGYTLTKICEYKLRSAEMKIWN